MATPQARLPYWDLSPDAVKALRGINRILERSGLDPVLIDFARLRASQINGCTYCIDKHTREALEHGETEERLESVAAWRESPRFDAREKAALGWTESLTLLAETHASDADFALAKSHLSDKEISDLAFVVAVINAWNRIALAFRQPIVRPVRAAVTQ